MKRETQTQLTQMEAAEKKNCTAPCSHTTRPNHQQQNLLANKQIDEKPQALEKKRMKKKKEKCFIRCTFRCFVSSKANAGAHKRRKGAALTSVNAFSALDVFILSHSFALWIKFVVICCCVLLLYSYFMCANGESLLCYSEPDFVLLSTHYVRALPLSQYSWFCWIVA